MIISLLATKQDWTAVIDEKMRMNFYSFLISCFIFTIISCGKTTEENVNDAVSKTNDNIAGGTGGAGGGATTSGDKAPTNVVFSKTIRDPDAKQSGDYEESASDVIKTSGGDYVVVGTSLSYEWPPPDNEGDILIVKLDGSGNILWNKKIHLRSFDTGTSVVEDNDGNYVLTGFTSSDNSNNPMFSLEK